MENVLASARFVGMVGGGGPSLGGLCPGHSLQSPKSQGNVSHS